MSPIKGRVIRLNKAINAPSTRSTEPAPKLENLSARHVLARMDFSFIFAPLPGVGAAA
jgi:hypothetical protein